MTRISFDLETFRFRPGEMAPKIVCCSWVTDGGRPLLMTHRGEWTDGFSFGRYDMPGDPLAVWARWALDSSALLIGHHVAFDWSCFGAHCAELMTPIFRAYRENRVTDTMYRQKLADIGRGMYRGFFEGPVYIPLLYDLGAVSRRAGYKVNKDDPWRLWYGLLYDVPLVEWPSFTTTVPKLDKKERPTGEMVTLHGGDAIRYALADPVATDNAYVKQAQKYDPALLRDEFAQARKYWALDLASTWGIRTSLAGALSLETGVKLRIEQLKELLLKPARAGAVGPLVRDDGSRDTKAAKAYMRIVCSEATPPIPLRLTKGGKKGIKDVCLDNDACQNTLDPLLMAYAEYASMFKVLSNDVEMLKKGTLWPIHCHFDLAETGRTTCAKPNLQNPRRLAGVREAFVPRGYAA